MPPGTEIFVEGEEFHHAARVARVREGEAVEIFDGGGRAAEGRVVAVERDRLRVQIERAIEGRESPLRIHLAMAIIQLEKFELVLQKATELGVVSLIPLITERVEVRAERYRGKGERWERIILEAVKQSGRSRIPTLHAPTSFAAAMERPEARILFDAGAQRPADSPIEEALLLIGPEGGWSPAELSLAREKGCQFRRLGPRRLRAETAAILAAGIITAQEKDI